MNDKIKLGIGAFITLALAISGTYYWADDDPVYYCESRDLVGICEKLSLGLGTRCYYEDTYKICKEGWVNYNFEEIEDIKNITQDDISQNKLNYNKFKCNQFECIQIK